MIEGLLLRNPDWLHLLATILTGIILLLVTPTAYQYLVRKLNEDSMTLKIAYGLLLGILWLGIMILVNFQC